MSATFITSARCQIEDIATIANFLLANNVRNLTRSGIVSKGVSMMAEIIKQNHPGMTYDVEKAMEFLDSIGIEWKSQRGVTALAKKLQSAHLDQLALDQADCPESPKKSPPQESIISQEDIDKAEKRREAELNDHIKAFSKLPSLDVE